MRIPVQGAGGLHFMPAEVLNSGRMLINPQAAVVAKTPRRFWLTGLMFFLFLNLAAYAGTLFDAVRKSPVMLLPLYLRVLLKQVYFTGIEALPILAVAGLVGGFLTIDQLYLVMGKEMVITIEVMRFLLVQEGAVFLVAVYVLARSGSAIASELASMRQNGEVRQMYLCGVDPSAYLVAPRVWGAALSVAALTVYVQILMVFGGFALMALFSGWDYVMALEVFSRGLDPFRGFLTILKAFAFGMVLGTVACQQGLQAVPGPQGIPVAARSAVVHSFAGILLVDVMFTIFAGR